MSVQVEVNPNGALSKHKVRLVDEGFYQILGGDESGMERPSYE